jgi:ubiquinone/menaquinone biosynthesis C-methylase UbiE
VGRALARLGAHVVGLDNSAARLDRARAAGSDFPLVHAAAEDVPLPDASFDVVFADHGAPSFADPHLVVPEVGRLLRPGGLFAFSHLSPLAWVCFDEAEDTCVEELREPLFGSCTSTSRSIANPLARKSRTHSRETAWARRWPMEEIRVVRKR